MLCEAYRTMDDDVWLTTPNHTNHVEALNRVSVASKQRISLSTQLQHMYREDRKRAYQHIADAEGCFRERRPNAKAPIEKTCEYNDKVGRYVMSCKNNKQRKVTKRKAAPQTFALARIISFDATAEQYTATYQSTGKTFSIPVDMTADTDVILLPEDYKPDADTSFNLGL